MLGRDANMIGKWGLREIVVESDTFDPSDVAISPTDADEKSSPGRDGLEAAHAAALEEVLIARRAKRSAERYLAASGAATDLEEETRARFVRAVVALRTTSKALAADEGLTGDDLVSPLTLVQLDEAEHAIPLSSRDE